jgi:uncharacterized lipoprotein YehR (DUF1307 family)
MKKLTKLISVVMATTLCLFSFTACDEDYNFFEDSSMGRAVAKPFVDSDLVFQASTRFLYSVDGGVSWSETIQEIPVGTTYFLAIEMQVSQDEETKKEQTVVATITIPNTNVLDCYLDDHPGKSITGEEDPVNNCIRYSFNLVPSTTPEKFRVVFECQPIDTGRSKVEVEYDDQVSENWDKTGVVKYVEAED